MKGILILHQEDEQLGPALVSVSSGLVELFNSLARVVGEDHDMWGLIADSAAVIAICSAEASNKVINGTSISLKSAIGEDAYAPSYELSGVW